MTGNQIIDKEKLVGILAAAFDDNKSVNYIIRQDRKRKQRIKALMSYSFDVCADAGKVFSSSDGCSYALVSYPYKKKTTPKSVLRDIKFIFAGLGISNVKKAMARESAIQKGHPQSPFTYLWFIGTELSQQGKGIATTLMNEIITEAEQQNHSVYLETSTLKNISWYEKFGFKIYRELDFGYRLFCMRRE